MSTEPKRRRSMPLREIVIVIVLLAVLALLALPVVRTTRNTNLARTCQGNLQEWAAIFAMYRAENFRQYPPPHGYESPEINASARVCQNVDTAFDFAPDVRLIFPDYANDPIILACPDQGAVVPAKTLGRLVFRRPTLDPKSFGIVEGPCADAGAITRPGFSYTYLGFDIHHAGDDDPQISEAQARQAGLPATGPANIVALLEQFQIGDGTDLAKAQSLRSTPFNRGTCMEKLGWPYIPYGGELDTAMLGPLNDGASQIKAGSPAAGWVDYEKIIDGYTNVAVMWDAIYQDASGNPRFTHRGPDGCNVLFMDGHVEFKTYPGPFPLSKTFATMKAVR